MSAIPATTKSKVKHKPSIDLNFPESNWGSYATDQQQSWVTVRYNKSKNWNCRAQVTASVQHVFFDQNLLNKIASDLEIEELVVKNDTTIVLIFKDPYPKLNNIFRIFDNIENMIEQMMLTYSE